MFCHKLHKLAATHGARMALDGGICIASNLISLWLCKQREASEKLREVLGEGGNVVNPMINRTGTPKNIIFIIHKWVVEIVKIIATGRFIINSPSRKPVGGHLNSSGIPNNKPIFLWVVYHWVYHINLCEDTRAHLRTGGFKLLNSEQTISLCEVSETLTDECTNVAEDNREALPFKAQIYLTSSWCQTPQHQTVAAVLALRAMESTPRKRSEASVVFFFFAQHSQEPMIHSAKTVLSDINLYIYSRFTSW